MVKRIGLAAFTALVAIGVASPALACGGLIAPDGGVNLLRTSTLAAYLDGVEHYITSFEFTGKGGGRFGSIVPLPAVPTEVKKGGRWTLQRLAEETQPPVVFSALAEESGTAVAQNAKVLLTTRVEALKIAVLKGGGDAVGRWAEEHGFLLPPDAPEVLDFYAARSPIFMAVKFDLAEARERGLDSGDGTPVHVTIPTSNPWVPLRILGLGKAESEVIEADVYLLTEREPNLLPEPAVSSGMILKQSGEADENLLRDLASDRGMGWLPTSGMWLTYLRIDATAGELDHDLAIDALGVDQPSPLAAGLFVPDIDGGPSGDAMMWWPWAVALILGAAVLYLTNRAATVRR
ncbi:MAG: DUF2330 domain-containing protein [Actinomycetota bacterium]|nr:DUF2330 domain-containing protein [Actinomycetota bacterium]